MVRLRFVSRVKTANVRHGNLLVWTTSAGCSDNKASGLCVDELCKWMYDDSLWMCRRTRHWMLGLFYHACAHVQLMFGDRVYVLQFG